MLIGSCPVNILILLINQLINLM